MKEVFGYIVGLGAPVMMPIIFTILGVCIGIKLGKALKSGLLVGVGFVGLSIVTALLTTALGPALNSVVDIYDLQLKVFDMGWPAAASIAYNTSVGALIIPICLGVNLLMLLTRTTKTVNIDLWNYWHFAFIGALAYFATHSLLWGFFAAVICYIITLVIADFTAKKFQKFYKNMDGISIPQPFCAGFVPFAWVINKGLDKIPGVNKINIDSEGMKQKFGLMGEPLFLGVVIGCVIGAFARYELPKVLMLGVQMGAVMELIPRITGLFIEGLLPISNQEKRRLEYRYESGTGYRPPGHAGRVVVADSGDHPAGGYPAGERIPSVGVIGRDVLCIPADSSDHEGQRIQNFYYRVDPVGRGRLYCDEPRSGLHVGGPGRLRNDPGHRRADSGRIQ